MVNGYQKMYNRFVKNVSGIVFVFLFSISVLFFFSIDN